MSVRAPFTLHALNNGEVSDRFAGRLDHNKYLASVHIAENWIPQVIGGLRRREGTIFVAKAKFSGQAHNTVRMMKFIVSNTVAYIVEAGHLYMRFYREINGVGARVESPPGTPVEVSTLYPDTMLFNLFDFQSADIKYIHSDGTIQVYKLERTAVDTFQLVIDNFNVPGTEEDQPPGTEIGAGGLTLSALTGQGITITAANAVWLAADAFRSIVSGAGEAVITSVDSATQLTADVISDFSSTTIADADWHFEGTPSSTVDPARVRKGLRIIVDANIPTWRTTDIGKFIAVYGGFIKIVVRKSTTRIIGHVYTSLHDAPSPNPPATDEWSLWRVAWTDAEGYPTCGGFFQNRRYECRDETVWGSQSADFENFALGSGDADGINETIGDDEINPIITFAALANIELGTSTGIFEVTPTQQDGPLTPNDFNVHPTGAEGVDRAKPIRPLGVILYIQAGKQHIRELSFNFVENKHKSPDMLQLADHLTQFNTLKQIDYTSRHDSIVWGVRDDGQMLTMMYERNEDVAGWTRLVTDGQFKSHAVIPRPSTGYDWVWVAVDRLINGTTETYIEYFEPFATSLCREWRELMTDSAKLISSLDGDGNLAGLDHLEGKTVWVIGDGWLFNAVEDQNGVITSTAVVTNGKVTPSPTVAGISMWEVGLSYVSIGETLEPVVPNEYGGPLMARGWEVCGVRFRRTLGLKIGNERLPFRQAKDPMDEHLPLKKGKLMIPVQTHDGLGRIKFIQDLPFPAEVLNVMGRVSIGDEPTPALEPEPTPEFVIPCEEMAAFKVTHQMIAYPKITGTISASGGGGGCPDCISFVGSVADQGAIDQCYIDQGCGGDPDCEEYCQNFFGDFQFGLNSSYEGDFPQPTWWLTPSTWIIPKGYVVGSSDCPGTLSKQLIFDFKGTTQGDWNCRNLATNDPVANLTPATFDLDYIHFCDDPFTDPLNTYMNCGDIFGTGSHYYSRMSAIYAGETDQAIGGVAMLTDDGQGPTMTGVGVLIDRADSKAKFVKWDDVARDDFTIVDEINYVPSAGDEIAIMPKVSCECPAPPSEPNPTYPSIGSVAYTITPTVGPQIWSGQTADNFITMAQYQALGYGALVMCTASNSNCDNTLILRTVTVRFLGFHQPCT